MPFDDLTRSRLAQFVNEARELMSKEFSGQFQMIYGLSSRGEISPLEFLRDVDETQRATAMLLRERAEYLVAGSPGERNSTALAVERLAREQAFTVINRLCALRMAETRGLIVESVGCGYQSKGFQVFAQLTGNALGDTYSRYRTYLYCLFDELAIDLRTLFDRRSPSGVLFPGETALLEFFGLLNATELEPLWAEDETIGWIYQYYNDEVERKRMRKQSSAPRNSRELAVRNQFFTPRYVVEFLTDNTLGRVWYEMTAGQTQLKYKCRFLAWRADDVFLGPGDTPKKVNAKDDGPAQIPYRPIKDPRQLRFLDPACGSMHFGLYAFDLLQVIYEEAWELSSLGRLVSSEGGPALHESFENREHFIRAIPKLIVEQNIHGIDIDPRAVQIAALSLWLRAQRSWHSQKLDVASRSQYRITRSNIVCAEPLGGSTDILEQFAATLPSKVLGQFLIRAHDMMRLAGEAGSLLKIEAQIAGLIEDARRQWLAGTVAEQAILFPQAAKPAQGNLEFDVTEVSNEEFWETLEHRVYQALKDYSEQVESGYARRLFADDAAHGFAFIDICRKHYDVIVMNPPFGEFSKQWKEYAPAAFPNSYNDNLAAFVDRWLHRLVDQGRLGAITSRTCFFLSTFAEWRLNVLQAESSFCLMADLGQGVMDNAMVEAAAYVLENTTRRSTTPFIRAITERDREACLQTCIAKYNCHQTDTHLFMVRQQAFKKLPKSPIAYWMKETDLEVFENLAQFEPEAGQVRQGLSTSDDPRFVRAVWEVAPEDTQFVYYPTNPSTYCSFDDPVVQDFFARRSFGVRRWAFHVKAGASQPWYSPITVKVNLHRGGAELWNFRDQNGRAKGVLRNTEFYYKPGFSWTRRAVRFYPYIVPGNCVASASRYMGFPNSGREYEVLGVCASRIASAFLRFYGEWFQRPNFLVDNLKILKWPTLDEYTKELLQNRLQSEVRSRRLAYMNHEPFHEFLLPGSIHSFSDKGEALRFDPVCLIGEEAESLVAQAYGFDSVAAARLERDLREALAYWRPDKPENATTEEEEEGDADFLLDYSPAAEAEALFSYCFGCAFGRWDIRFATGERTLPELPDPMAPLPVCPPGMLQNERKLPASEGDLDPSYPLRISWSGILVDEPGHPEDVERRIGEVLQLIWAGQDDGVESQNCRAVACESVREYFRKPTGFFANHLKRYTKSRRQAPIYWPLSTRSGDYTIWLYYPRLSEQTLHTVLADFVDPKLKDVKKAIQEMRDGDGPHQRLEELLEFEQELLELRSEVDQVIRLPYKPSVNDGVLISASPLWELFRLPKWQTDLRSCWEGLERGDFDWAHLAFAIRPDQITNKCKNDRCLAIAHDLEHLSTAEPVSSVRTLRRRRGARR